MKKPQDSGFDDIKIDIREEDMRPEVQDVLAETNIPAQIAYGRQTFTVSEFKELISVEDNKLSQTRKISISGD